MTEWCAIIYDKKGSDRSKFRPQHLAAIPAEVAKGNLVCAGAIFNEPTTPGGERTFAGSHLQIVADTKEDALKVIHNDIFAKEGIWDLENIIIYQFGCAVREPKK